MTPLSSVIRKSFGSSTAEPNDVPRAMKRTQTSITGPRMMVRPQPKYRAGRRELTPPPSDRQRGHHVRKSSETHDAPNLPACSGWIQWSITDNRLVRPARFDAACPLLERAQGAVRRTERLRRGLGVVEVRDRPVDDPNEGHLIVLGGEERVGVLEPVVVQRRAAAETSSPPLPARGAAASASRPPRRRARCGPCPG